MCRSDEVARHLRRGHASGISVQSTLARAEREPDASGRGARIGTRPRNSVRRGPDSARIRAFLFLSHHNRLARSARRQRSTDRTTEAGGRSLTIRRKTIAVLAAGGSCKNADGAQLAERDFSNVEATSSRLVIRSTTPHACGVVEGDGGPSARTVRRPPALTSGVPMHSVAARQGVGGAGCARPFRPRSRAARHHIRRDARVWTQPKWRPTPL